ncbi:unnamed protein product [Cuscuta campestris]|uniref:Uncharacterized protein n=1 Tax=Cuscuta campestris TaxID=132261 RepID=A0A484K8Q5_9ASTE|nr:unnamed protein product [Cuscuta campestris]
MKKTRYDRRSSGVYSLWLVSVERKNKHRGSGWSANRSPPEARAPPAAITAVAFPSLAAPTNSDQRRRCFLRLQPPSPSFQPLLRLRRKRAPPSPFAQWPSAAVDCSTASRCSSPSNCRSATVAGVRHRRRIRPLPRVDITGRLTPTPD